MNRVALPTLLSLLKTADRIRAGMMTEGDRQFIGLLLSRIARDEDVRDYFFASLKHRPKAHSPAKGCAAMLHAIAEHKGEKISSKEIQRLTGLNRRQVDDAKAEGGEYHTRARDSLRGLGLELAEFLLDEQLDTLHENQG